MEDHTYWIKDACFYVVLSYCSFLNLFFGNLKVAFDRLRNLWLVPPKWSRLVQSARQGGSNGYKQIPQWPWFGKNDQGEPQWSASMIFNWAFHNTEWPVTPINLCNMESTQSNMDKRKKRSKWYFKMKFTASSLATTVSITAHKVWRFQDCVLSRGRPRRLDTFSEICWVIQYLTPKQLALAVTKVTPYIWLSGQCELDKGPVGHICPSSYS